MYCDYPLDSDSTLELKLTKTFKEFNIVFINLNGPK